MSYAIIYFDDEESCEAVPLSWYNPKTQRCAWPDKKANVLAAIRNRAPPSKEWSQEAATYVTQTGNYIPIFIIVLGTYLIYHLL